LLAPPVFFYARRGERLICHERRRTFFRLSGDTAFPIWFKKHALEFSCISIDPGLWWDFSIFSQKAAILRNNKD